MIKHNGRCHCGNLSIETEYDPILVSLCNCSRCRKMFGTVNSAAMFGEQEIIIKGEAKKYDKKHLTISFVSYFYDFSNYFDFSIYDEKTYRFASYSFSGTYTNFR